MRASRLSSTIDVNQSNVSPLTTPPGLPPSVPRPTDCVGSLRSLIIKNNRLPTRKLYRSQVPSTRWRGAAASTPENSVLTPSGSIHFCHHHASGSASPLRSWLPHTL